MKIEQIYTKCLAQGAYYILDQGEAAIIDPLREIEPYLDKIKAENAQLKYVFETHYHADFVSGHLDLSAKTGAEIVYGPNSNPVFNAVVAEDAQEFKIGRLTIRVIHTPGHTLESTCYLLLDENNEQQALFSGDTLFLGDVGRPDLAQKLKGIKEEDLAGMLYDSLYNKILPLTDSILVYPGHGAGSTCGKNMMNETVDTLGNQKKINYALNQPNKERFIKAVLDGLLPPPNYFAMNVHLNKTGYANFDDVLKNSLKALGLEQFENLIAQEDIIVLDTRSNLEFYKGFVPKSIHIGIDGDFAPWVGNIIGNVHQKIVLVTDANRMEEVITRLGRIGFDNVIGYLEGGIETWLNSKNVSASVNRIDALTFENHLKDNPLDIIDVRAPSEYAAEHVMGAHNKPLPFINTWIEELDLNKSFYLHCAGGYRSMIAASLLHAHGFRNFIEIQGGFAQISSTNIPKSDFVCSSKISNK